MTTYRATLVLLLSAGAFTIRAQDAPTLERVHSGSGGTIPIERASLLKIEGVAGTLVLRGGKPGELRYEARTLDDRRQPRAIAIDRRGSSELRLGQADPATAERLIVEVAVAPQLSLEVRAQDTRLIVTGIGGEFDVRGERLDIDVRGNYGAVSIDLDTGKLHLENASSDVHVAGKALEAELRNIGGKLGLELEKSRAMVDGVAQATEAHLEETGLVLSRGQGLRLEATGGSLELRELAEAVEARLEGTPLKLTGGTANVQIESDEAVEFSGLTGPLSIQGYGGTVRGTGGTGSIHVKKSDAEISLGDFAGSALIQGDRLHVRVSRAKSTVQAETVSSEITIEDVAGAVTVKNEFGDVSVARAGAGLRVDSRNGRVVAQALKGQVDVRADGDEVSVEWAELSPGGDQRVENASGKVVARLPGRATCRVEAESTYGTVRSAFPAVERTGERSAAGNLNGGTQPVVRIKAGGDVELEVGGAGTP
jgi:putative adhesin